MNKKDWKLHFITAASVATLVVGSFTNVLAEEKTVKVPNLGTDHLTRQFADSNPTRFLYKTEGPNPAYYLATVHKNYYKRAVVQVECLTKGVRAEGEYKGTALDILFSDVTLYKMVVNDDKIAVSPKDFKDAVKAVGKRAEKDWHEGAGDNGIPENFWRNRLRDYGFGN